ncbi:hypothetical protein FACS189450_09720 [Spirochaetia bacterium]|nr:hypothetical protein FACS189450_09720 [Spirochaetia bacterium]
MKERFFSCALALLLLASLPIAAQDFGFGDITDEGDAGRGATFGATFGAGSLPFALSVSGEAGVELLNYVKELDKPSDTALDIKFKGKLNFEAEGTNAKAVINLNVSAPEEDFIDGMLSIDEAYLRAYFGNFEIEGGLRKLTWGKADSNGPLDVINPFDYSEFINLTDLMKIKLPRPLIHGSYRIGSFSKIEAVVLPWFAPHRFAETGRWAQPSPLPLTVPSDDELRKLKYAQAGARFTTTIGPVDFGAQYFYGRMYQPSTQVIFTGMMPTGIDLDYNRYHQIGIDYAQVIAGFNLRAEAAANLTDDFAGDNGAVQNPAILWSLGFDRDLFLGINLNLQCNESIRLMHSEISEDPLLDTEAGSDITTTRITAVVSKKFLRDELEVRATGIYGIEDKDFLIIPGIFWTIRNIQLEFSSGIFGGGQDGQLGQYRNNSFIKIGMRYAF